MRSITDTMRRLAAQRSQMTPPSGTASSRLTELRDFGSNPGALRAFSFVPARAVAAPALVVVLHGCTQTAAGFDQGTGWSELAQRHGFALLFPEQTRANNFNLCFNWYAQTDSGRHDGEPVSIIQMIEAMAVRHGIDRGRIFVTGLSAGGAMTAVMLATHPEIFAGGAIIAGLPYRCAASVPEAFDRMRGQQGPSAAASTRAVLDASPHRGPWPSVSVWHGDRDMIVDESNGRTAVEQWRGVHGIATKPTEVETRGRCSHQVWRDAANRVVVEEYRVAGMGHGVPLSTSGVDACGAVGPYMLDVGISSTSRIARSWELTSEVTEQQMPAVISMPPENAKIAGGRPNEVGEIIENALRAAGIMR